MKMGFILFGCYLLLLYALKSTQETVQLPVIKMNWFSPLIMNGPLRTPAMKRYLVLDTFELENDQQGRETMTEVHYRAMTLSSS